MTRLPDTPAGHRVVVLGASPKPARYSNRAVRALLENGYRVIPVHPKVAVLEGLKVRHSLREIGAPVHTLTVYVNPDIGARLADDIIRLNPLRVIFNPGTELPALETRLRHHDVRCIHGCTLVMLRTRQF